MDKTRFSRSRGGGRCASFAERVPRRVGTNRCYRRLERDRDRRSIFSDISLVRRASINSFATSAWQMFFGVRSAARSTEINISLVGVAVVPRQDFHIFLQLENSVAIRSRRGFRDEELARIIISCGRHRQGVSRARPCADFDRVTLTPADRSENKQKDRGRNRTRFENHFDSAYFLFLVRSR